MKKKIIIIILILIFNIFINSQNNNNKYFELNFGGNFEIFPGVGNKEIWQWENNELCFPFRYTLGLSILLPITYSFYIKKKFL